MSFTRNFQTLLLLRGLGGSAWELAAALRIFDTQTDDDRLIRMAKTLAWPDIWRLAFQSCLRALKHDKVQPAHVHAHFEHPSGYISTRLAMDQPGTGFCQYPLSMMLVASWGASGAS